MKKITFSIDINAAPAKVWETMLAPETYKEWVNPVWPGSYYEGEWKEGHQLRFISPGRGGTLAVLEKVIPYHTISAKHIAIIKADGTKDTASEAAKSWMGTTENYTFTPAGNGTRLQLK